MTSSTYNPVDRLQQLLREGKISRESVLAIMEASPEWLESYLAQTGSDAPGMTVGSSGYSWDSEDDLRASRLTGFVGVLTHAFDIEEDERVHAIIETFPDMFQLSYENVAALTGLDARDIASFMSDPSSVSFETRYKLGVRCSYLLNAIGQARGL